MTAQTKDCTEHVEALIGKAAKASGGLEAMQFSQAACNAANAMCALVTAQKEARNK